MIWLLAIAALGFIVAATSAYMGAGVATEGSLWKAAPSAVVATVGAAACAWAMFALGAGAY